MFVHYFESLFPNLEDSSYHNSPQFPHFVVHLGKDKDLPGLSCKDISDSHKGLASGVYWIDPTDSKDPFTVFCDMTTDGGKINHLITTVSKTDFNAPVLIYYFLLLSYITVLFITVLYLVLKHSLSIWTRTSFASLV